MMMEPTLHNRIHLHLLFLTNSMSKAQMPLVIVAKLLAATIRRKEGRLVLS